MGQSLGIRTHRMYYFHKHRIGFFHIPKTGGSSFSAFLSEALSAKGDSPTEVAREFWHEPLAVKRELIGAELFEQSTIITTVRNPYATVVSFYFWCRRKVQEGHADLQRYPWATTIAQMSFSEYIDWYMENERSFDEYLLIRAALPANLRIARLEHVHTDAKRILNDELNLDIDIRIPVYRTSIHAPFMSYMTPEFIRRINDKYHWAFEHLYSKSRIDP